MKVVKFYKCNVCGNATLLLKEGKGEMVCCNQPMVLLKPNTSDGTNEKHVPFLKAKIKDCELAKASIYEVQIGSVEHPMSNEHHIEWIGSFDDESWIIKWLKPTDKPIKNLKVSDSAGVYEYCNLHGLWKK